MSVNKESIQESEYGFPYHYIPEINEENYFCQHRNLRWGYIYLSYLQLIIETIGNYHPKSVLDIGCGDGRLLFEIRRNFQEIKLTGYDISKQAVSYAKAFNFHNNIQFECKDITRPSAASDERYECITLIETLEHIPPENIDGFLSSIRDRLKDDGILLITVPSKNVKVDKKHYQHFNLEDLAEVTNAYFKLETGLYINSKSRLVRRIDKFISNKNFIIINRRLINWLYKIYYKHFFYVKANSCKRIFGIFSKNVSGAGMS